MKNKTRTTRSPQELKAAIGDSLRHLLKSARDYDAGDTSEGKRIGLELRKLLNNNPPKDKSALFQLQGTSWSFANVADDFNPNNLLSTMGLVSICMNDDIYFEARTGFNVTQVTPFPKWWASDVVLTDDRKKRFTRMDLVRWVAGQDGAHIDDTLEEDYYRFILGTGHGWVATVGGVEKPMYQLIECSLRTIAHETLLTFRKRLPEIFPAGVHAAYDNN